MKPTSVHSVVAATALLGVLLAASAPASAQAFLVGAQLYSSSATGASLSAYQFSTNSATGHASLPLSSSLGNGTGLNISFQLPVGDTVFSYSVPGFGSPGTFGGLNLFFNNTGNTFNPAFSGVGIPGNLSAVAPTAGGAFFIPVAGTNVLAYNADGSSVSPTSYSGATSFLVGGNNVSIIGFTVNNTPAGTFTVRVTQQASTAPEPGAAALLAVALLPLAGLSGIAAARRRR